MHQGTPELEVKDLRLVRAIAEAGGVTAAARRLHLTQSAVSHHLGRLEARLGVALFRRVGRGLEITAAGERVARMSVELDTRLLELERTLQKGSLTRRLRLATQCYTAYHWLPPLLDELSLRHPAVSVVIELGATSNPLESLLRGELDLAICHDECPRDAPVRSRALFRDRFAVVVGHGHRLATRRRVRPSDLEGETLLLYEMPNEAMRTLGRRLFEGTRGPARVERLPLTEAIMQLVRSGRGVSIVSSWAAEPYAGRGEVVGLPLSSPHATRRWRAVYAARSELSEPIAALVEVIKARGLRAPA